LLKLEEKVSSQRELDKQELERADKGKLSDKDVDRYTAAAKKTLAQDTNAFEKLLQDTPEIKERTFKTGIAPASAFNGAADGGATPVPDMLQPDIKPRPGASVPAPK
jgi:hypothetical protein